MTDPRVEAAAIALYVAVQPNHRTPEGWNAVKPIWRKHYEASAVAVIAALDKAAIITDPEDADSLPSKVLILTEQGGYWESIKRPNEKNWWQEPGTPRGGYVAASEDLTYPARIIHRGTE